VQIY
ncbi:hypothetical protein MK338_00985, partial [Streptococcus vestibularis]